MITHYLKVAFRGLWKYKVQSAVSALSLAVGIVVSSVVYLFVDRMLDAYGDLPDCERRVRVMAFSEETGADVPFCLPEVDELVSRTEGMLDSVSAYSGTLRTDVEVIGKDGCGLPYIVRYKMTDSSFFRYFNLPLLYGGYLPELPDEIVVSSGFAEKISPDESPVGMTLRLVSLEPENGVRDYRIVNVADVPGNGLRLDADCYFPLEAQPFARLLVYAFMPEGETLSGLDKALGHIGWNKDGRPVTVDALPVDGQKGTALVKSLILLLASLMLISGLISFLKFTFEMFYARQHELALRKSLGSDAKGIFCLLSAEVFCMLSFAFLLSLVLMEILVPLVRRYLPEENMRFLVPADCYLTQTVLYLIVLLACLLIATYPAWRVRRVNLVSRLRTGGRRHGFRIAMICVQLFVSMGFLGAVIVVHLSYDELRGGLYCPLEEEEESRIVSIGMTTATIRNSWNMIRAEIDRMPEIEAQTSVCEESNDGLPSYRVATFLKRDSTEVRLNVMSGNPDYFGFFHIPMRGKVLEADVDGFVYVSRSFSDLLTREKAEGMVRLDGRTYQIAGVYEDLFRNMTGDGHFAGSVFFPECDFKIWLLKVAPGKDVGEVVEKITSVCRKYVPHTLPLDVYRFGSRNTYSMMDTLEAVMWALAAVSLLLVVLSVYSSISMDAVVRQKEVAVRKINGALRRDIFMLFVKPYVVMFLLMFVSVYPLLRLMMVDLLEGSSLKSVYGWEWGAILFVTMALLISAALGWQIMKLMRINPAEIIKKE